MQQNVKKPGVSNRTFISTTSATMGQFEIQSANYKNKIRTNKVCFIFVILILD
jgi:hypothetical protein